MKYSIARVMRKGDRHAVIVGTTQNTNTSKARHTHTRARGKKERDMLSYLDCACHLPCHGSATHDLCGLVNVLVRHVAVVCN